MITEVPRSGYDFPSAPTTLGWQPAHRYPQASRLYESIAHRTRDQDRRNHHTMKIKTSAFRVDPKDKADLTKRATDIEPLYASKKKYHRALRKHVKKLSSLQRMHYASCLLYTSDAADELLCVD